MLAILLILFVLLAPMSVIPSMTSGQTDAQALAGPIVVKVGIYENPPKEFTDENGDVHGLFPDVIEYVATAEGWELEYVLGNWTECLQRLESDQIDVLVDVAISDERLTKYDFSNESVLLSWGVVYARPNSGIESIPELDGKRMAVMRENIHTVGDEGILSIIQKFQLNVTVVEYDDLSQVFESLDKGEVDVGVVNRIFGAQYQDEYNVVPTPIIFDPSDLRFAFPKNSTISPYLIERVDYHLDQLKKDPNSQYYQSLHTYLPELFEEASQIPWWLIPALFVSLGILAIIALMNFLLRCQVRMRTSELRKTLKELEQSNKESEEARRQTRLYFDFLVHDAANIISPTLVYSEMIASSGPLTDGQQSMISKITKQTQRLSTLIVNSRRLEGMVDLRSNKKTSEVDLVTTISNVENTVRQRFFGKKITFNHDFEDTNVKVNGGDYIEHLLDGLLDNAVRYTETTDVYVDLRIARLKDEKDRIKWQLDIADRGQGIPDDLKEKLIAPMDSSNRYERGVASSLMFYSAIVRHLGGTIVIENRVPKETRLGTRVVVILPKSSRKRTLQEDKWSERLI